MRGLESISASFVARVEPCHLDRGQAVVDPGLALQLRTEHRRTFELATLQTPTGREEGGCVALGGTAAVWQRVAPAQPDDPVQNGTRNPTLDRLLDDLGLSLATSRALAAAGIRTIGELCRRTEAELLGTRNVGRGTLGELKVILADLGLSLGMRDA